MSNWEWRIQPRGRASHEMGTLKLSEDHNDFWSWSPDLSGKFSVKSLTFLVQNKLLGEVVIWNSWVHGKVNICA